MMHPGRDLMEWIDTQAFRDPFWADTEMEVRRAAVRILRERKENPEILSLELLVPGHGPYGAFQSVRIDIPNYRYVDGLEELLMVEKLIRDALYANMGDL